MIDDIIAHLVLPACAQCRAHAPLEKMSARDFLTGQQKEAQFCEKCRKWMSTA